MHIVKKIKEELEKQLKTRKLTFAGEYLDDYYTDLENSAEYIHDAYEDVEAAEEKVNVWFEETLNNQPNFLESTANNQTTETAA